MFHRTSPAMLNRPAAFVAGAALLGACALAALPAQAATVGDADSPWNTYYVPAETDVTVSMEYYDVDADALSDTFPAGTYWVEEVSYTNTLPLWIEELEDQTVTWSQIVLEADGPLDVTVATGAPNSGVLLSVWEAPADAPDPSTLSEEERTELLVDEDGIQRDPDDIAWLTAANIAQAATDPFPEIEEGHEMVMGDFYGIGADVPAIRKGNVITVYGPDGVTKTFAFGRATDTMLVGDWNGDGKDTFGMRRGHLLFLDDDLDGGWAEHTYYFGRPGDEPLVGDWDGDKKDTIAVRRGNTFYVTNNFEGGYAPISFTFGRATDEAFAGDWNQDGKDTIAVLRNEFLYVKNTLTGGDADGIYTIDGVG